MNVLSLFDGMSCGQIALKQLGVKVDKYYASEIDKHAIKQTMLNFHDTIQLGSVTDVDVSKLDKIDLLIGGSPCTNFSFAGKRNGMSTTTKEEIYTLARYLELKEEGFQFEGESFLFWEYMRILNDIRKYNPDVKFLLENVEMGNKWERVLSEAIGVFGVHINSALVSAQNRKRIYWTNIRTKEVGLFGEIHADIPQPEDKGILLRDILESEVDEKYYLSDAVLKRMLNPHKSFTPQINPEKTGCLSTGNNSSKMSFDSGTTFISIDGKSKTVRTGRRASATKKHNWDIIKVDNQGTPKVNHSDIYFVCVAARGRESACLTPKRTEYGKQIRKAYEAGDIAEQRKYIQQLEPRVDGKTNTLTTVQKDNLIYQRLRGNNKGNVLADKTPNLSANSWEQNNLVVRSTENYLQLEGGLDSDNRFFFQNGKHGACLIKGERKTGVVLDSRIRRLTPTECARLQTVPDWYEWGCSDTQQYKMLGNGWTVDVIAHILSFLNKIES